MALLAEELVEEWLNRQGFFTIRGLKLGVHEIDLLGIRPSPNRLECRHVEVQASVRPVSYISDLPKAVQKSTGRNPKSRKARSDDELKLGIAEFIAKKFDAPSKRALREKLVPPRCAWTRELVLHKVAFEGEVDAIRAAGITVHRLVDVVSELQRPSLDRPMPVAGAAGSHLLDLIGMATKEVR